MTSCGLMQVLLIFVSPRVLWYTVHHYCGRDTKFSYVKGGGATQYASSVAIGTELS